MPDEDKTFSGFLVLDLRIWWRHVHTLYRNIFSNISDSTAFLLQGVTENYYTNDVTNLKYGKHYITSEKINNTKKLSDTAKYKK